MDFNFYSDFQPSALSLAGVAALTQRFHADKANLLNLCFPKTQHDMGAYCVSRDIKSL